MTSYCSHPPQLSLRAKRGNLILEENILTDKDGRGTAQAAGGRLLPGVDGQR